MKKFLKIRTFLPALLAAVMLSALPALSTAQPANALGIRFTGGIGIQEFGDFNEYPSAGAELSYQHYFSPRTRLEADFGFRIYDYNPNTRRIYPAWLVATSYQWRWPVGRTAGFYAGPVLQFGRPYFWFGVGAQTGFDWQFDVPVQLFVDVRPTWSWWSGVDACLSFGLRYLF